MPRTSRFIEALRAQRWRESNLWQLDRIVSGYWDTRETPRSAAQCARIAGWLQGASQRTLRLIGVTLPRSMSRVERGVLRRSHFARFTVHLPWQYHTPGTPSLAALVHLEFAMEAPADFEPDAPWTPPERAGRKLSTTTRILDFHIQSTPGDQMPTLFRVLGRSVVHEAHCHIINPIDSALQDIHDDGTGPYLSARQIEVRLQGDDHHPFVVDVVGACREAYNEYKTGRGVANYIHMDEAEPPKWLGADASFMAAIEECATGRIPRARRPRRRDVPNGTHHLLLRTDPALRAREDGMVVNRAWLAEKYGWDFEDLAEIPEEPGLDPIEWSFLVDDATGVFCAKAWRPGTLDIEGLAQWVADAWARGGGLLRGTPARLSFPAGYCDSETRASLADAVTPLGVALTTPASGGAAPISLLKMWCEQSLDIGMRSGTRYMRRRSPMKWEFVEAWTSAQMLAEHTYAWLGRGSGSPDEPSRFDYTTTAAFGRMRQIKVAEYAAAAGVNDLERFFGQWLAHATAPGTGFVAPKRIPRRRAAAATPEGQGPHGPQTR